MIYGSLREFFEFFYEFLNYLLGFPRFEQGDQMPTHPAFLTIEFS